MAGYAFAWVVRLAVIALQVINVDASAFRSGLQQSQALHADARSSVDRLRLSMLKTVPPFDINPDTFLSLVASVPTDSLLLFFSPTCPDCEKLMPLWTQVTREFENNQDVTILTVSDDEGKAPPPYFHDENPAVFFIPRGDASHPITFPMSYLHEFVALPETGQTDADIVNKLIAFVHSNAAVPGMTQQNPQKLLPQPAAVEHHVLSESQSSALTARLLASLKAKESAPIEEQMKIVNEPHYQMLPVVKFLNSPAGVLGPPLAQVAATYLDGMPMATQWATQYAREQESRYRQQGWNPTSTEEQSYFQDLLDYATPLYASSIYFQRGLKR
jgi:thiol-disulfide isomerase/thioredoxin